MAWVQNQINLSTFVMVDASNLEVTGLEGVIDVFISINGGDFAPASGTVREMGAGWYAYLATIAESQAVGVVSLHVNAPGCVQQNLEYEVGNRTPNAVAYPYHVTVQGGAPVAGASVIVTLDANGTYVVAQGVTDALGTVWFVLQPGTYYFWTTSSIAVFTNPDMETVP